MSNLAMLYKEFGQSPWLDYVDRNLVTGDGLRMLVEQGLRGVTSNPTIFYKALSSSTDYDEAILDLMQAGRGTSEAALYEWLAIRDVRMAADILAPVFEASDGSDGFVSIEVSPHIAYQADETLEQARHLWRAVDRPNVMIKVPGTEPGLLAVQQLLGEGININVTLLFSVQRYREVAECYQQGLTVNPDPASVASVASFFLSRIDSSIDPMLERIGTPRADALRGRIGIASAKLAYEHFRQTMDSHEATALWERGGRPQRLLWASTGTKNPAYSDVMYVDQLIGPDTVNTMTRETLNAFQAHGTLRAALALGVDQAHRDFDELDALGIDIGDVTRQLEQEGVQKFCDSHDLLLEALAAKCHELGR